MHSLKTVYGHFFHDFLLIFLLLTHMIIPTAYDKKRRKRNKQHKAFWVSFIIFFSLILKLFECPSNRRSWTNHFSNRLLLSMWKLLVDFFFIKKSNNIAPDDSIIMFLSKEDGSAWGFRKTLLVRLQFRLLNSFIVTNNILRAVCFLFYFIFTFIFIHAWILFFKCLWNSCKKNKNKKN